MIAVDTRTRQYGDFYGLNSVDADDARPLWIVYGDFQAEALRVVLDAVPDRPYRTMRIPPVRELDTADLPFLQRAAADASVLVSQPIKPGYRQLPIGTVDIAALMPSSARTVRWPVIRYSGLYPFHVTVRHIYEQVSVPVPMPYHDLRTIMCSRSGLLDGVDLAESDWDVEVEPSVFVTLADRSVADLALRETTTADIGISDALRGLGERSMHTIAHPGNELIVLLAQRILDHEGVSATAVDPGKPLLGHIRAPFEARVLKALDVDSRPRMSWWRGGVAMSSAGVRRAQMKWYAEHPEFVDAAVNCHRDIIDLLGLDRVHR